METRAVVTYSTGAGAAPTGHEASTRTEIARRLAAFMGYADAGEYDATKRYATPPYFVPADTLPGEMAAHIGIRTEHDLFGGVVPYPYVASKMISHPLIDVHARAPRQWSTEFPRRVADVVLDGFSAFDKADAVRAGRRLLEQGAVRVKPATGIASLGQSVADNAIDLVRALDAIEPDEIAQCGVVVEQNLADVTTYSIGQLCVADVVLTYCGTQCVTKNNHGVEVYGGSEITVVPGDFDALLALQLHENIRLAIDQARVYDKAARECFAGFFASRRNYDVAHGRDPSDRRCSGVLEQSWRLGGASGAEICALEAFRADPSLHAVRAATREVYGEPPALPADAVVLFSGVDPKVGKLTKYAWKETHVDTR